MNASNKLLDRYAQVCGVAKDNDIATRLRVSKQAVSGWRNAKAHPNAEAVEKMCTAIGEPLRSWLPLIEAERARTPADKKVWLRLAQAAASLAMIYLFSRLDVHSPEAGNMAFAPLLFAIDIHYAKLWMAHLGISEWVALVAWLLALSALLGGLLVAWA